MIVLDGRKVRDFHRNRLIKRLEALSAVPTLALFQVGDNPASNVYIGQKVAFAQSIGARVHHMRFPEDVAFDDLEAAINKMNADQAVHGIIVQLPLPAGLDKDKLIDLIDPAKDVDGLTTENQRLLAAGRPGMIPATAKAVLAILDFYKIDVKGKKAAVLGRSKLVGSPTAKLLSMRGAEVTVCHSKTPNTQEICAGSDLIVSAVGKARLVNASYVKKGAIIIDVGMSNIGEDEDKRLSGDVDQKAVAPLASAMTPVPGGVGPVTVLCLFDNVVAAAEHYSK